MDKNTAVDSTIFYNSDLICFSHLRWKFVFQRPQHLLTRFSKLTRVFYFEEPVFGTERKLHIENYTSNIYVVTPHLPGQLSKAEIDEQLERMIDLLITQKNIERYCCWYYTPMALDFTGHLKPEMLIYDCMDELSAFKFAPTELLDNEKKLLERADIVFTGGYSLYYAKQHLHPNIHPFPSSIDKEHFGRARILKNEPEDQKNVPHPRFGFFGVLDERFDLDVVAAVAKQKPDWHFILVGPVVKIDPAILPRLDNIHYPGPKQYDELPQYLAGWDVAIIPFAINESTKYISPTKTPEYLSGGKPVISTPIRDVVSPYGDNDLVHIVSDATDFIRAGEIELDKKDRRSWLRRVDAFLASNSWDNTFEQMLMLIERTWKQINNKTTLKVKTYV